MTELEVQIVAALRQASEERVRDALIFLAQLEKQGTPAAAPRADGGVA